MGRGIKQDVINNPAVVDLLLSIYSMSVEAKADSVFSLHLLF